MYKKHLAVFLNSNSFFAIRKFVLNGIYSSALFSLYALTLSPFISDYFNFGGKDLFISVLGFSIFIGEFFAFKYKLKVIEIGVEEKRIAWKKHTGNDIIPNVGYFVWFAFFIRLCFRMAIVMVSMTALGFECSEKKMSTPGLIVLLTSFFLDICGTGYLYFNSTLFSDSPVGSRGLKEERLEQEEWNRKNFPGKNTSEYHRKDLISDIVLVIYGFIVYTSFWQFINQQGTSLLYESLKNNESAMEAAIRLFSMLFCMIIVGLMPARLAYWIEDSTSTFAKREKIMMYLTFCLAAILTCLPSIIDFIELFILGRGWRAL